MSELEKRWSKIEKKRKIDFKNFKCGIDGLFAEEEKRGKGNNWRGSQRIKKETKIVMVTDTKRPFAATTKTVNDMEITVKIETRNTS